MPQGTDWDNFGNCQPLIIPYPTSLPGNDTAYDCTRPEDAEDNRAAALRKKAAQDIVVDYGFLFNPTQ